MKSRIIIIFIMLSLGLVLVVFRAAYLQIAPNQRLSQLKEKQFNTWLILQSRRGAILDRKGRELALSFKSYSLYADPYLIEQPKRTSKKIAKELGVPFLQIHEKIKDNDRRFVWLQRHLSKEKYEKIKGFQIRGLSFVEEFKRVYPNDELFASALGLVGAEGQGLEGLELYYDRFLHGNKKKLTVRRDARGRPLLVDGMLLADHPEGAEIKLTLDADYQYELENQLKKVQMEYEADRAFGVILDAETSAILAMGSTPFFNANDANKIVSDMRRNKVITDLFEPGSTMKTFTVAAALREGKIAPNTTYNTESGAIKVNGHWIREADSSHSWKSLTVSEILAFSSNVGVTKIAFDLGAETLRKTLSDFGFGEKTGIGLYGEAKGVLQPLKWNKHLLSNVSFGQGVSATALQVANAYAAIANGGVLHKPYLVQSITDPESRETTVSPNSVVVRRVLSEEQAHSLRLMLLTATAPGGTGTKAQVEGFLVGGKTGTAQKINSTGTGYLEGAYLSSFVGFFPSNSPKYVIFVGVDHPKKNSYYGSHVAAPVFSNIASYISRVESLAPSVLTAKNIIPREQFLSDLKKNNAQRNNEQRSNEQGNNKRVDNEKDDNEQKKMGQEGKNIVVPDLYDLTARAVLKKLNPEKVRIFFSGSGKVVETNPPPGTPLNEGDKIKIILK